VLEVVKVKTSIYTDKELWERYKSSAAKRGLEVSQALEEVCAEELVEDLLDEALREMGEAENYEIDFKPFNRKRGL